MDKAQIDWPKIVDEHGPVVLATARRLLANDADAADCFQRTFISALEFSRKQSVRSWPALLRHLATIRALERLRERKRDAFGWSPLDGDIPADARTAGPLQSAQASELAEHLKEALAELDSRQAEVFCLASLEDFSYQQIAEQLGISVNHVGVLLNRARTELRERLESHAPTGIRRRASSDPM